MRKETITYEDYNGEMHTEDFYFNLNEMELSEYQVLWDGGIQAVLKKIQISGDYKITIDMLKKLMEISYGEKNGNRFDKYDEHGNRLVYRNFFSTGADSALFSKMIQGDGHEITDFISEIMPKRVREDMAAKEKEEKKAEEEKKSQPQTPAPANK